MGSIVSPVNGGYAGKILRVDLTKGKCWEQKLSPQVLQDFIGGSGLGAYFLYKEVPAEIEAFDPRNLLIFASGPLGGTLIPGSGTYSVITKSPKTGTASAAHANGFFGSRMRFSGFDALVIQGSAEDWVYLYLKDGRAEIRDAKDLLGKDTWETDQVLREKYGSPGVDSGMSIACIGPAGENLVSFAGVFSDRGHCASSGGPGSVMGSKKLKAIVAAGGRGIPVPVGREEQFKHSVKKWIASAKASLMGDLVSQFGTAGFFTANHDLGRTAVKNLTANVFPQHAIFNGDYLRKTFNKKPKACQSCALACCIVLEVTTGPYKGFIGEQPENEGMAGWGSNIGNTDPGTAIKLNNLCDRLGMDVKEATFVLSMAMECYEKGIINREHTDGIDLTWGNTGATIEMMNRIANRQGFGHLLAEGVMRASQEIGKEAHETAVYVKKGTAPHVHDPRGMWGMLFCQTISNMCTMEGLPVELLGLPELGFPEPLESFSEERLPMAQAKGGPKRQFEDTLGVCMFACQGSLQVMVDTLNTITGFNHNIQTAIEVGERVINVFRLFNIIHGLTVDDDTFSPRLAEPPREGPVAGKSITPVFEKIRRAYYAEMGWNEETGKPLPETLKRLRIDTIS